MNKLSLQNISTKDSQINHVFTTFFHEIVCFKCLCLQRPYEDLLFMKYILKIFFKKLFLSSDFFSETVFCMKSKW